MLEQYDFCLDSSKKATICLDDNFAHDWCYLNQLHEVVSLNGFQLTGMPCQNLTSAISYLLNETVVLYKGSAGVQKIGLFNCCSNPLHGKNR